MSRPSGLVTRLMLLTIRRQSRACSNNSVEMTRSKAFSPNRATRSPASQITSTPGPGRISIPTYWAGPSATMSPRTEPLTSSAPTSSTRLPITSEGVKAFFTVSRSQGLHMVSTSSPAQPAFASAWMLDRNRVMSAVGRAYRPATRRRSELVLHPLVVVDFPPGSRAQLLNPLGRNRRVSHVGDRPIHHVGIEVRRDLALGERPVEDGRAGQGMTQKKFAWSRPWLRWCRASAMVASISPSVSSGYPSILVAGHRQPVTLDRPQERADVEALDAPLVRGVLPDHALRPRLEGQGQLLETRLDEDLEHLLVRCRHRARRDRRDGPGFPVP